MKIRIDHHIHQEDGNGVATILRAIFTLLQTQGDHMTAALTKLTTEVEETKTVQQSAIMLLTGLSEQLKALKDDPAAIEQLANDLDASSNALAAAVQANTPATE